MAVFKQWPIYFIGRILPAGVAFFGMALYMRLLEPATVGIYALLLSTSLLAGTVSFAWLRVATLRMSGTIDPVEEPNYAASILALFCGMSLVAASVIIAVIHTSQPSLSWTVVIMAAGMGVASGWFELNVTARQSRLHLVSYSVLQAARALATLISTLLLIKAGFKVEALLGGYIIGNAFGFGALGVWRPALRGRVHRAMIVRLWRFGWPSSVAALGDLSAAVQAFILQGVVGAAALGIFSVATNLAMQPITILMVTAALAGQPLAFRARDNGTPEQLVAQLRSNARLIFGVGFAAAAGLIGLAGPLVNIYLGPNFRANGVILIVLCSMAIFVSGMRGLYFEQAFEIAFYTRPVAILQTMRAALSILLAIVLIRSFGVVGAACGFLATELIMISLTIVWSRRHLPMPIPAASFAKIAIAAAVMIGAVQLVPGRDHVFGLALAILVGVVTYGLSFALLYRQTITELVRIRWPSLLRTARS